MTNTLTDAMTEVQAMNRKLDEPARKRPAAKKSSPNPRAKKPAKTASPKKSPPAKKASATPRAPKPERVTRKAQLEQWLRRPEGVTIAQMQEAFGVLPHSARAMLSTLNKTVPLRSERSGKDEPLVYRATE